jgi:acyl carrier protein
VDLVTVELAREKIAEAIEKQVGVAKDEVLKGSPFLELHHDFDSLTFIEIQLMIEEEFKFEFDRDSFGNGSSVPQNVNELAEAVVKHYQWFNEKKANARPTSVTPLGLKPGGTMI